MKPKMAWCLTAMTGLLAACASNVAPADPPPALEQTVWVLEQLEGEAVAAGERGAPLLRMEAGSKQVSGFSGCNRFSGSLERSGSTLRLGPLAGTRMACAQGMELEQRFLRVLGQVDRYSQDAERLYFYVGDTPVARFKPGPRASP